MLVRLMPGRPRCPRLACLALALALAACDGGDEAPAPAKEASETKAAKAEDEALAKRKAEREAKAKAEEEKAAELTAQIDALAVLPEDASASMKLDKACKKMTTAYDAFMQKVLQGDMLTKWKTGGNEMQISIFDRECKKSTPKVALCQAHALEAMAPELEKELPTVMKRCAEKFGGA